MQYKFIIITKGYLLFCVLIIICQIKYFGLDHINILRICFSLQLQNIARMSKSWVLLFLVFFALAAYSQPVNNLCSNAIQIPNYPFSYTGSTVGSSKEHTCNGGQVSGDVWFAFTFPTVVTLKIGTCSSGPLGLFDTWIYLVSGSCGSYTCLQNDDQGCGFNNQAVKEITIQAGAQYDVVVSRYFGATGTYTLTVNQLVKGCEVATTITSLPYSISTNLVASSYSNAPCFSETNKYGDWYAYTSPSAVAVRASTCNTASFDSVIYYVFGSCPGSLTCGTNNDDSTGCTSGTSQLDVLLSANQRIFFLVAAYYSSHTGPYSFSLMEVSAPNDVCGSATAITTLPYSTTGTTSIALRDYTCTNGVSTVSSSGADVWYSFTPAINYADISISVCESLVSTAVYLSSGSCGGRQCIQSDSSSCVMSVYTSGYLRVSMQAGTTYYIAAAAVSTWGSFQLDVAIPPANDRCTGAIEITSLPFSFTGSTDFATWDYSCSLSVRRARDIFFRFTPASDYTNIAVNLCGSDYDTYLYISSGSSCGMLTCLAYDDDSGCGFQSYLTREFLSAGTTYYFIVSGYCNPVTCSHGSVNLLITGTSINTCTQPATISTIPYSLSTATTATSGGAFSCTRGSVPVNSVSGNYWFKFTPSQTYNHVFVSACSSSFNSALFLVSGSCDSLQCSPVSNTGSEYCTAQGSRGALISDITLQAGVGYLFVVTGATASDFGTFTFTMSLDASAALSISSPAANAVLGRASLSNLLISGQAGTYDARGTVSLTIRDSLAAVVTASTTVDFASQWSVGVNLLGLADGLITVNAALLDLSQNVASATVSFTKDTTTFVYVSVPASSSIVNSGSASSVVVAGTGEVGGSVFVTLMDGDSSTPNVVSSSVVIGASGTWSTTVSITALREGTIRIAATIRDSVGNTADSPTVTINKDTTATVSILAPTSFQYVISQRRATSVTISGFADDGTQIILIVSDEDRNTADVRAGPVSLNPMGTWSMVVDVSSLSDGNLFFVATATDLANNAQSQTITLKKDAQVFPATSILTPANGAIVSGTQVSALVVSGTAEANARISLRITGTSGIISRTVSVTAGGTWTTTVSISTLPNGAVTIGGTVSDSAGNSDSISAISFTKA